MLGWCFTETLQDKPMHMLGRSFTHFVALIWFQCQQGTKPLNTVSKADQHPCSLQQSSVIDKEPDLHP